MSAGPDVRSPSVRPAQMAAVHPVQDGSGGDPVVWGCFTVLPHVTCSVVSSASPGSLGLHASALAESDFKKKKKDSYIKWCCVGFVWNESFFRTFSICTVNLCYFKVLTLELDCIEELCSVPNLLHLTELKNQKTVEDFHRPMLVIARAWNQMLV